MVSYAHQQWIFYEIFMREMNIIELVKGSAVTVRGCICRNFIAYFRFDEENGSSLEKKKKC
jgi:hypothetical protein